MLSAFTLCYVPFALLPRDVPSPPMLYYAHLSKFYYTLLLVYVSHASYYHAINKHYELESDATLREMWLQKLSKRVLSRPRTQLNSS